jgi:hypothetical protein
VTTKFKARKLRMAREYYVEAIGPDGLKHHVGPFKLRSLAKEWIAQHGSAWDDEGMRGQYASQPSSILRP